MFDNNFNRQERSCPVDVGTTYTLKIEDQGKDGDGIARVDGFVVFVPGAEVGQEVSVKINATRRKFGFGEIVDEEEESVEE
ncbi:MAG: TRAM domain-containing protein [Methanobrevibacter sp.]|jgi:predicted RNA-binding protein with TRAM domain|nr:TRAM domain-containing protein [Candidatus Methanovirga australis]